MTDPISNAHPLPGVPDQRATIALIEQVRRILLQPTADSVLAPIDQACLVAFAALLHGSRQAAAYLAPLQRIDAASVATLQALAEACRGSGPMRDEVVDLVNLPLLQAHGVAPRLQAALQRVHQLLLAPHASSAAQVNALLDAGWSGRQVSSISQITAATAMLIRMDTATVVLDAWAAPRPESAPGGDFHEGADSSEQILAALEQQLRHHLTPAGPRAWVSWVPIEQDDFNWKAHFDDERAARQSFRASAGDRALARRLATLEDAIFAAAPIDHGPGLWRRGRELGALAASCCNGCVVCTSIHAMNYARFGGKPEVALALAEHSTQASLPADVQALANAAFALTQTPINFGPDHVHALTDRGMDRLALLDFIHAVAYFNFANRMVLSLGGTRTR